MLNRLIDVIFKMPFLRNYKPTRAADKRLFAYSLLVPAFILVFFVVAFPLYRIFVLSFHETDIFTALPGFKFSNYVELLTNPHFSYSLFITILYVFLGASISFLIGLGTALLLNRKFKGRKFARLIVVLPWPIPGVVAALIWAWILDPSFGVFNYILVHTGLVSSPVHWFSSTTPAFLGVLMATVWKGYPFFTLMLLAALQAIPNQLYEAARVDGANSWQQFRRITIPALRSVIAVAMVINSLWLIRQFSIIFILTEGGPSRSTETLAITLYKEAFRYFNVGYASSIGVVTFILSVFITIVLLRYLGEEFY